MIDRIVTNDITVSVFWKENSVIQTDIAFGTKGISVHTSHYAEELQEALFAFTAGIYQPFPKLPLDFSSTPPFFRKVYEGLCSTCIGEQISYKTLARLAGSEHAVRAVGQAMARNRFPFLVPCHRVIHADGRLGAYTQKEGVAMKAYLLQQEAKILAKKNSLEEAHSK